MTRTKPTALLSCLILGGALGWFLQVVLVAMGLPRLVPPVSLAVVLVIIAVIVVAMAVPVYRVVRGTATQPVDPFYATRVVVLAKASSLAGALLAGGATGLVAFFLLRSTVSPVGSILMAAAVAVGAVALLVAGLVAEKMCTLPPPEETGQP